MAMGLFDAALMGKKIQLVATSDIGPSSLPPLLLVLLLFSSAASTDFSLYLSSSALS